MIYKIKFLGDKRAARESVEIYDHYKGYDKETLEVRNRSVIVEAPSKKAVRKRIEDIERRDSYEGNCYCFGREDEDFEIKKMKDSYEPER